MFETPRYRVTGTQPVLGHDPGTEFEEDLDPAYEAFLLAGGHLTRIEAGHEPGDDGMADEQQESDADDAAAEPDETPQPAAEEEE